MRLTKLTARTDVEFRMPPRIEGPSAWYGPEVARRTDWIEYLSRTEVQEVERAAKRLASKSGDIVAIRSTDF
ncbi:MAG TPA: hypothetical protein VFV34_24640, partial [Blastocatellia bacterium]|nr:hypothetical protein [Blastocatellia bacterium]